MLVVLLLLLAVFILQNTQKVEISFFGRNGQAPLAASLLIATVAGALVVATAGALRILQLATGQALTQVLPLSLTASAGGTRLQVGGSTRCAVALLVLLARAAGAQVVAAGAGVGVVGVARRLPLTSASPSSLGAE